MSTEKKHYIILMISIFLVSSPIILPISDMNVRGTILENDKTIPGFTDNVVDSDDNREYWALLIGVGVYADHPEMESPSNQSAEAIYGALLSFEYWQEDHVKLITCENATKTNIFNGLRWLDEMENEDDVSLVYIATHGGPLNIFGIPLDFPPRDEEDKCDEVLVTYYGFRNPLLENLRDDELNFFLNRLESQGICVIIDSCYAGGFNDPPRNPFRNNIFIQRYNKYRFSASAFIKGFSEEISKDGRVVLMATEEHELGYAAPGEGHCFTNVLLESLQGGIGDFNDDDFISAEEAFTYTRSRVRNQHPTIYDGYDGELSLIISGYEIDFFDDFESENVEWTTIDHTGGISGDLWHISENNSASPTHCWYLGNENTERYNNDMNNSLVSNEIELGENPILTFVTAIEAEKYDSFYLDVSKDNWYSYQSRKVSGPLGSSWGTEVISLYSYPFEDLSGKTIQLRFRFSSDGNIPFDPWDGSGFLMIDDVLIYSKGTVM